MAVKFYPIQEGTGDPSPTNIRPITAPLTITGIGSIYGGTFDTRTGVLTETWGGSLFNGNVNEFWAKFNQGSASAFAMYTSLNTARGRPATAISNYLTRIPESATWGNYDNWSSSSGDNYFTGIKSITTVEAWKGYLSEHNLQVAYELTSPITHTLTPSQYAEVCAQLNLPATSKELLMRRRNLATPHIATASGAVTSFNTDMASPLKSCQFAIEPVQSGTGDPSPSNVRPISGWTGANISRTGANLLDMAAENIECGKYITVDGTIGDSTANFYNKKYMSVKPSTKYTFSFSQQLKYFRISEYTKDKIFIRRTEWDSKSSLTALLTANTYYIRICCNLNGTSVATLALVEAINWMMALGETVQDYTPYTGNTYPVQFPTTKNLLNNTATSNSSATGISWTVNADKSITLNGTTTAGGNFVIGTATLSQGSYIAKGGAGSNAYMNISGNVNDYGSGATFTIASPATVNVKFYWTAGVSFSNTTIYPQIEAGSTATAYEPYGTIYGGYIDPVRGVAVAEMAMVDLGTLNWIYSATWGSAQNVFYAEKSNIKQAESSNVANMVCEGYKTTSANTLYLGSKFSIVQNAYGVCLADSRYTDAATFKTAVAGVQLVYELATPIEYPLTPQVIKSLKGQNNVWADCGNASVKYWKH